MSDERPFLPTGDPELQADDPVFRARGGISGGIPMSDEPEVTVGSRWLRNGTIYVVEKIEGTYATAVAEDRPWTYHGDVLLDFKPPNMVPMRP